MDWTAFVVAARTALHRALPGSTAHALMAPRPPRQWPAGFRPEQIRGAAGLLLFVPHQNTPHLVLTRRSHSLDRHGGQVSMPGGVIEAGESIEQAARREAHEEIGLHPDEVDTLGPLTPIDITVSGFRLHPIAAVVAREPRFAPAAEEVDEILLVPFAGLLDPQLVVWRSWTRDGRALDCPAFPLDHGEIWGATAMVIAEFLVLFGWPGPPERPVPAERPEPPPTRR